MKNAFIKPKKRGDRRAGEAGEAGGEKPLVSYLSPPASSQILGKFSLK
jgi:hypothetical protein